MKIAYLFSIALFISIVAFRTAQHIEIVKSAPDDAWVELINGKDFTGWKPSENKTTWTVTPEGYLQAVGKRSHLFYEGEYLKDGFKNFEMEALVRTYRLANSGIYFHTEYQESGWPSHGIEIQVNNSHIGEGDYIELKKMASLYGVRNIYKTFARDGEWMTVKARVESNHVQIWLNGLKTVDYVQPEKTFPSIKRLSKGTFCLQGHDSLSKMQYKSFRVRRLPDNVRTILPQGKTGPYYDSLVAFQNRQFAFIDLNPQVNESPAKLADYVYATGINVSYVKPPANSKELSAAGKYPLFTGIRVNAQNQAMANTSSADYIIGQSTDLPSARALLQGGKINIWSDKGIALNEKNANELLDLAKRNNIAIEIDNMMGHPSVAIIKMAKDKGCKFTFSGLIFPDNTETSLYVIEAIKGAQLTYKDQYIPKWHVD